MSKLHITTSINNEPREYLCEPNQSMLDVLRDELGLTGTKEGCGTGDCGACSILVDGRLVCACLMLGAEAQDADIETIEGVAGDAGLHPLQVNSSSTQHSNVESVHLDSLWRRKHCSKNIRTLTKPPFVIGWLAISVGVRATTRSSAQCKMQQLRCPTRPNAHLRNRIRM